MVPALGAQQGVELVQDHARLDPDQQVEDPQRLVEQKLRRGRDAGAGSETAYRAERTRSGTEYTDERGTDAFRNEILRQRQNRCIQGLNSTTKAEQMHSGTKYCDECGTDPFGNEIPQEMQRRTCEQKYRDKCRTDAFMNERSVQEQNAARDAEKHSGTKHGDVFRGYIQEHNTQRMRKSRIQEENTAANACRHTLT